MTGERCLAIAPRRSSSRGSFIVIFWLKETGGGVAIGGDGGGPHFPIHRVYDEALAAVAALSGAGDLVSPDGITGGG